MDDLYDRLDQPHQSFLPSITFLKYVLRIHIYMPSGPRAVGADVEEG